MKADTQRFGAGFLTSATGARLQGAPGGDRVVTDSRDEVTGALFVALRGPTFDGHEFVRDALARGAGGAIVAGDWSGLAAASELPLAIVTDTLAALQDLSGAHRRRHPVPLVAITGSNGKTSTKELLAAAVAPLGPVLRTRGNLNNHIGLPLTLLGLRGTHAAAVVEMGLNHPGELVRLSELARPQVAVITNVGAAHLEGLGSVEGVARAKADVAAGLDADGVLVTPYGVPELEAVLVDFRGRRITFGLDTAADVHPRDVRRLGLGGLEVTLPDHTVVRSPLLGEHVVLNLLAAMAAAGALGVPAEEAARGVAAVGPVPGRLQPVLCRRGTILDDSYNANPASVRAALAVLNDLPAKGPRWAVLGDMLELGPTGPAQHREVGGMAGKLDGLITVGELARGFGEGALEAGLPADRWIACATAAEAGDRLVERLDDDAIVLVKGSRGVRLEIAVTTIVRAMGGAA